ncbi:MAG: hypothetical protein PHW04_07815 [Candidatus Wallbacteria bacterium]|nr:hypothetical protein [Candidatus Wallbacteria bacterium]
MKGAVLFFWLIVSILQSSADPPGRPFFSDIKNYRYTKPVQDDNGALDIRNKMDLTESLIQISAHLLLLEQKIPAETARVQAGYSLTAAEIDRETDNLASRIIDRMIKGDYSPYNEIKTRFMEKDVNLRFGYGTLLLKMKNEFLAVFPNYPELRPELYQINYMLEGSGQNFNFPLIDSDTKSVVNQLEWWVYRHLKCTENQFNIDKNRDLFNLRRWYKTQALELTAYLKKV